MGDLEEEAEISAGSAAQISRSHSFEFNEDPAFWKDHNVQVDSVALRDSQLYTLIHICTTLLLVGYHKNPSTKQLRDFNAREQQMC